MLLYRGEFNRMPRVSLLCFSDCNWLIETFITVGTFDRVQFVKCFREFALSGNLQQQPGRRSVWILDSARIHCHPSITYNLRSIGIIPIFLPAYGPFFNPIEFFFGIVKKQLRRNYCETSVRPKDLIKVISTTLDRFCFYPLGMVFKHCGYSPSERFNPVIAYSGAIDMKHLGFD